MKLISYGSVIAICGILLLTGCAPPLTQDGSSDGMTTPGDTQAAPVANTDPKLGWVVFDSGNSYDNNGTLVVKKCDGSTLVYVSDGTRSGGISTVANSPECVR